MKTEALVVTKASVQMQIDAYSRNTATAVDCSWHRQALDVEVHPGAGITAFVQSTFASKRSSPKAQQKNIAAAPGGWGLWRPSGSNEEASISGSDNNTPSAIVKVLIGNKSLMTAEGLTVPQEIMNWTRPNEDRGRTCVHVAVGGAVVAAIAVQDPIKPEARGVVARLSQMNVCSRPPVTVSLMTEHNLYETS